MSTGKKLLFSIIVVAGCLLVAEIGLFFVGVQPVLYERDPYVGFAGSIPLFEERETAAGPLMVTAPNKIAPHQFFNRQEFPRAKPAGAYRIFCMGGSTTHGRPYDDKTSFCGWLRELLAEASPGRRWEVINAGGVSYASYRVALLMEELVQYEPDLFLIYSGHNEFLERRTYGEILERSPLLQGLNVLLARTRLYAAIYRLLQSPGQPGPGGSPQLQAEVTTLLDAAIGPQHYERDDAFQQQVLQHYEFNVGRMVDIADSVGADVILATVGSNLAHSSPFKSEPLAGLGQAEVEQLEAAVVTAQEALAAGRPADAIAAADAALALDRRYADAHYARGRALLELSRPDEAKAALTRALDEDICPLRALTSINEIVAHVAAERQVPLVDFVALVERRSPDGIPGETLFLDHVHPTIEGNRLLALAFLEQMIEQRMVEPGPGWGDDAVARVVDRVEGALDTTEHANALQKLASVLAWAGKFEDAKRLADRALKLTPEDPNALYARATSLEGEGEIDEALAAYEQTLLAAPQHLGARMRLGDALWSYRRDADGAMEHLGAATDLYPEDPKPPKLLGIILSNAGRLSEAKQYLELAARRDSRDPQIHYDLGVVLGKLGDVSAATGSYRKAIEVAPDHAEAHNNLGLALAEQGDLQEAETHFLAAIRSRPDFDIARQNLEVIRKMRADQ